ncbi:hypothetical protein PRIPAC_92571 [Pristionchus pacificus]|uniref:Uncharacterized protein n=1 Tax=Pristionchus pacificus TaxID=54126 RepID=A0A2A6BPW6_PRIPA|nr:hypothetical protein PRIPAC_92571 [Pristionchus pacificus]|eukprot:PDM67908.1 hypothetical protein PRIPAC_45952 [Pristionchus pacificus]
MEQEKDSPTQCDQGSNETLLNLHTLSPRRIDERACGAGRMASMMCSTFTRLLLISSLLLHLVISTESYLPKIFLYSDAKEDDATKEVFWYLGRFGNPVKLVKQEKGQEACSNETLTANKIHAGRAYVVLFKDEPDCDLPPEIPVLQWYLKKTSGKSEEADQDDDGKPAPILIKFAKNGTIDGEIRDVLKLQVNQAIANATQNKHKWDEAQQQKKASTSSLSIGLIVGLFIAVILVSICIICYFRRKKVPSVEGAPKDAKKDEPLKAESELKKKMEDSSERPGPVKPEDKKPEENADLYIGPRGPAAPAPPKTTYEGRGTYAEVTARGIEDASDAAAPDAPSTTPAPSEEKMLSVLPPVAPATSPASNPPAGPATSPPLAPLDPTSAPKTPTTRVLFPSTTIGPATPSASLPPVSMISPHLPPAVSSSSQVAPKSPIPPTSSLASSPASTKAPSPRPPPRATTPAAPKTPAKLEPAALGVLATPTRLPPASPVASLAPATAPAATKTPTQPPTSTAAEPKPAPATSVAPVAPRTPAPLPTTPAAPKTPLPPPQPAPAARTPAPVPPPRRQTAITISPSPTQPPSTPPPSGPPAPSPTTIPPPRQTAITIPTPTKSNPLTKASNSATAISTPNSGEKRNPMAKAPRESPFKNKK